MKRKLFWAYPLLLSLGLSLAASSANAESFSFTNITAGDYEKIVKELSANFNYTTVTPASSLGKVWGFEFGTTASMTKSTEILNLVKRANPSTSLKDNAYNVMPFARLTVPMGITVEAGILPKTTISSVSVKETGGALQWTVTDVFLTELPVTLAAKAYYTKATLNFTQTVSNVNSSIAFEDTIMGVQAKASRKFLVFEPYAALGYAKADGDLTVTAGTTIFGQDLAGATSASSSPNSAVLTAGVDIQLLFLSLGAEYNRAFGTNTYAGRLSFRF